MATDTVEASNTGHQVFVSSDGGNTCSATGVDDNGTLADGTSYSGFGKLYYNRVAGVLVEPAFFQHPDGRFGVGISVSDKAVTAFAPKEAVSGTTMFAHWPAIAIDAAGTVYVAWDTYETGATRAPVSSSGKTLFNQ